MPRRSLRASSARPSQTPLEGRADDASCLTPNTVARPSGEGLEVWAYLILMLRGDHFDAGAGERDTILRSGARPSAPSRRLDFMK